MKQETFYILLIAMLALTSMLPIIVSFIANRRHRRMMNAQMQQREEYLNTLQCGDEVILLSGIHGKIIAIHDSVLHLQIAKNAVVIYVEKDSVMGKAKELLFK
ncbi:preprotein translocase subunit YajC [Streptococcus suis]|nr:preprotein translocase subunit YajC [Streptococcus suis]